MSSVYLVVGNETVCKGRVAEALARSRGAWLEPEVNAAGVRCFTKPTDTVSDPVAEVVETTPLRRYRRDGVSLSKYACQWVSQNSLKRMLGKSVFVVCVAALSDATFTDGELRWMKILNIIFKGHSLAFMILVDTAHDTLHTNILHCLERHGFPQRNVQFVDLRGDLGPIVKSAREHSTFLWKAGQLPTTIVPFFLETASGKASYKDTDAEKLFGPWAPERVILIGRTGSGKSTVAQMLTLGKLDPENIDFVTSSGLRGQTKEVEDGQGRGWYVVDTPGLGEPPQDAQSAVPESKARKLIQNYVSLVGGTYSHFIYVVKKDRVDKTEEDIWKFFAEIFGEQIQDHFTIVVSDADQVWMDENMRYLATCFVGCKSFVSADFHPIKSTDADSESDDEEVEAEYQQRRTKSLKELEDELAMCNRFPKTCEFGSLSPTNLQNWFADLDAYRRRNGNDVAPFLRTSVYLTKKTTSGVFSLSRFLYRAMKEN